MTDDVQLETTNTSDEAAVLQALLIDGACPWQVYNCKLIQQQLMYDAPMSLLQHYDTLDGSIKAAHPLTMPMLKRMNELMSAEDAAVLIGVSASDIARAWQVKYVGKVVVFCEPLQLALRLHFSNTSKPAQAVYGATEASAWQAQATAWRTFGVVDVLTKGVGALISVDAEGDVLPLTAHSSYQTLPSSHSLALTSLINEHQAQLSWLSDVVYQHLTAVALT